MKKSNTQLLLLEATPLLTIEGEKALFTKLAVAQSEVDDLVNKSGKKLHEHSQLWAARNRVKKLKSAIVRANLPIVVRIAQRMEYPGVSMEQFVSEGLLKVLQCIDAFDVKRGFKFSTYLYRSLYRMYYRFMKKEQKRNAGKVDEETAMRNEEVAEQSECTLDLVEALEQNKANLDETEMFLVLHHFGIGGREQKTIREIHSFMSKNFVGKKSSVLLLQQILAGSIQKLREILVAAANSTYFTSSGSFSIAPKFQLSGSNGANAGKAVIGAVGEFQPCGVATNENPLADNQTKVGEI
jgi:RNA polymerase sigma factor (sigma-70 family)